MLATEMKDRKHAEDKFRGLLEAAPDAIVITNEKGKIVLINRQTEKLFDYSKDELIGKQVEVLIPADLRAKHRGHRTHYMEAPKVRSIGAGLELYAVKKDGTQFPVEISLSPLVTQEGTLISASVRDITDRKKNEEKLKEFEHFFNNSNDLSCIANKGGYFEILNPSFKRVLGYSQNELSENPFLNFVHPDDIPATLHEYEKLKSGGHVIHFNNRYRKKDGRYLWFDWNATPNPITGKLYCIARDITDRKKMEDDLRDFNKELILSQKTIKESEARFRNVVEQAINPILILKGEDLKLELANYPLFKLWNVGKEAIGKAFLEILPEMRGQPYVELLLDVLRNGVTHYGDEQPAYFIRENGKKETVYFNFVYQPYRENDGSISGVIVQATDVSVQVIARKKVETNETNLITANKELAVQNKEKEKRAAELLIAHKELAFENEEKEKRAAELIIANQKLSFESKEKEKRATELIIANKELAFQNKEKERRAAELLIANKELLFQNDEKGKRETELSGTLERVRFLASIADNIQDPVISTDNDSNITRWNKPAEELFGWKSEEAIGKKTNELLKAVYPYETREEILIMFSKKGYWNGEIVYHTKSCKPLNVLATSSHLKDADGNITGNLTIVRDITKRKNAEEALKQLNAALEQKVKERTEAVVKAMEEKTTILESIGDAFFAVDKNWKVTYWNRVAEIALSVPKNIIIDKNLWDIFSDSLNSISYKKYHEAMATGVVIHFEDYYAALNKWYEISAYPSVNGLSVYFKDITERKRAAEEITELNSELEERVLRRTEQLKKSTEEMEAFSYSVSHDLRAPLRGIIGFANILEEDYASKLDDEAKRITAVIKKNTSRMGLLIDDLLSFSRMGRQELMKTNLDTSRIVRDIVDDFGLNKNNKKIKWVIHPLLSITADINTINQVWINLISNAIKYSGNVTQPKIEIGSSEENGSVNFFVKDNGVGFDEKYKAKLFKVFQRLHSAEEFEGTGIGLAIVDKIIDKHGGKVWAEGELNKGATFHFSLPVDKDQKTDE